MTITERNESIEKIKTLPAKLEAAVKGLSDNQLNTPYGEGKWTLRQVAHHIADANMNAYTRMKLVATEQKPILKPYDQNPWAEQADSLQCPVEASLVLLRGLHERWVRFHECSAGRKLASRRNSSRKRKSFDGTNSFTVCPTCRKSCSANRFLTAKERVVSDYRVDSKISCCYYRLRHRRNYSGDE